MNPVVHFEMPADDKKRVAAFYSNVFGWNMKQYGPDMGEYVLAQTTETDANGMVKNPGAINGGFYGRTDSGGDQPPHLVISVPDVKAHMEKVKSAGGEILHDPMDIPGIGSYVSFKDTEGNIVGMLQPVAM